MLSKNRKKLIDSLRLQKYRQREGLFVAEGVKLVDELLASLLKTVSVFATMEWIAGNKHSAKLHNLEVVEIDQHELAKISTLATPNQVLAVARIPDLSLPGSLKGKWVLALDQIRDPGNLGTIIRTADWFGIDCIVAANGSVDIWNPKVVQASMGSVFRMPVYYVDMPQFLEEHSKEMPVYGTLLEGQDVTKLKFAHDGIVVVGNESHGISESVMPFISEKITIPSAAGAGRGGAESLNASIATAVICYEIRRQFST